MAYSKSGFSLIELLVALGVLAIAGLALLQAVQQSTRGARLIEARSYAALAAENILNSALLEMETLGRMPASGVYELDGGHYEWTIITLPTDDPALVRLQLDAVDRDSGQSHQIVTFRSAL